MSSELLRILGVSTLACAAAMLLVLLLRRPLRARFGARAAYALWLLVPAASMMALLPARVVESVAIRVAVTATASNVNAADAPLPQALHAAPWLALLWAGGAACCLILALLQQRRFLRALGRLTVIGSDMLRAEATAGVPALVGALRPRIVLPADFERRYAPRERALILVHERLHRARGDAQVNALAVLLRCVFWFNPLVYFAASRFRFDQELACDASVIAHFPQARRPYADAMLKTQLADLGLPAGCHWQSSHPLKERIAMLKQPLPGRARSLLGAAVACALIAGGSYTAWAVQPAQVIAAAADTAGSIRGDITLSIDGGPPHTVTILTPAGVPFAVADGDEADRWELVATATPQPGGAIDVAAVVKHGDSEVGRPRVVAAMGAAAELRVEDSGGKRLDVDMVMTTTRAAAQAPPARAGKPSEDYSFRQMQPPQYPLAAIKARQSGRLVLDVEVDAAGAPRSAQVAEAEPPEAGLAFSEASLAAAMNWRYNPGVVDGHAQGGHLAVPIDFRIVDDE